MAVRDVRQSALEYNSEAMTVGGLAVDFDKVLQLLTYGSQLMASAVYITNDGSRFRNGGRGNSAAGSVPPGAVMEASGALLM